MGPATLQTLAVTVLGRGDQQIHEAEDFTAALLWHVIDQGHAPQLAEEEIQPAGLVWADR